MRFPRRKPARLECHDYSTPGIYYVTICIQDRRCILGEVEEEQVALSQSGAFVRDSWLSLKERFKCVDLDEFVVMPNHLHGLLEITELGAAIDPGAASSTPTLGRIIRAFKSISAIAINRALGTTGRAVWQRGYYDHVVRDDADLERIRKYIRENWFRWAEDEDNPIKGRDR